MRRALGLFMVMLVFAGCSAEPAATELPTQVLELSTATPLPSPVAMTATSQPTLPGPNDLALAETVEPSVNTQARTVAGLVIDDLAERLDAGADEIIIHTLKDVFWQGRELDCAADTGQVALTPDVMAGFWFLLQYQGELYEYRTDHQLSYIACDQAAADIAGEPVILDTLLGSMIDLARRNLAERLDLPLRRVFLVEAAPVQWPDTSLGCAITEDAAPTPVPGYRIVLRVGPEDYFYHSNYRQVILCPADAVQPLETVTPTAAVETPESE